jgi:hypothetical protein
VKKKPCRDLIVRGGKESFGFQILNVNGKEFHSGVLSGSDRLCSSVTSIPTASGWRSAAGMPAAW